MRVYLAGSRTLQLSPDGLRAMGPTGWRAAHASRGERVAGLANQALDARDAGDTQGIRDALDAFERARAGLPSGDGQAWGERIRAWLLTELGEFESEAQAQAATPPPPRIPSEQLPPYLTSPYELEAPPLEPEPFPVLPVVGGALALIGLGYLAWTYTR